MSGRETREADSESNRPVIILKHSFFGNILTLGIIFFGVNLFICAGGLLPSAQHSKSIVNQSFFLLFGFVKKYSVERGRKKANNHLFGAFFLLVFFTEILRLRHPFCLSTSDRI